MVIALVLADIDKRKIRKGVIETCAMGRKITLLKDATIMKRFEEQVAVLVDVGAPNLWGTSSMGYWGHLLQCNSPYISSK